MDELTAMYAPRSGSAGTLEMSAGLVLVVEVVELNQVEFPVEAVEKSIRPTSSWASWRAMKRSRLLSCSTAHTGGLVASGTSWRQPFMARPRKGSL
jgi:hypothetical protein